MPLADAVMTASLPILGIGTIIISLDIYRDLRRSASPFYGVADEFGEVLLSQPELRGIMKGLSQKAAGGKARGMAAKGMLRLPDSDIVERAGLVLKLLEAADAETCAAMI